MSTFPFFDLRILCAPYLWHCSSEFRQALQKENTSYFLICQKMSKLCQFFSISIFAPPTLYIGNSLYRKKVYMVQLSNVKLFFGLSKNCQNYVNFCNCDLCFLYRPYLRHYSSKFKLCRNKIYIMKLRNVKLFFSLSENRQNYVSFPNFWLAPLVRATSPTLLIGIQSNFTERIHI